MVLRNQQVSGSSPEGGSTINQSPRGPRHASFCVFVGSFVSNPAWSGHGEDAGPRRLCTEQPLHLFGRVAITAFEEMPVRIHRELDRGVSQALGYLFRMDAFMDRE